EDHGRPILSRCSSEYRNRLLARKEGFPRAQPCACSLSVEGAFQLSEVELLHGEHGLGQAGDLLGRPVPHHLTEGLGNDLPRDAEAVLAPATSLGAGYGGELFPVAVDLRLVATLDHEGDGLVEGIAVWITAVHGDEPGLFAEAEIGE